MFNRILILFIAALLSLTAGYAQKDIPANLPKFDQKLLHFGFQLGLSSNGFALEPDFRQDDSLIGLNVGRQPGFVIRVVSELHMGSYFGLRFTPGIAFAARDLQYNYYSQNTTDPTTVVRTIESTFIDIPLYLKYRSARVNNFAQYVFLGMNYSVDLASQEYVDNQIDERGEFIVKIKRNNYMAEFGFGFDFFMEYFKFSPELRFSYGLNNIIVQDGTVYANPVEALNSRIFVLSLNFEG
ncbi:MAG: porin family protein [Salibacteraceae bacterium]